ncbi:MAG: amino acid racemase [Dictyoglomi bacterium]|nr:amino acid racemase [Dictyoglomota bacterium]
MEKLKKIGILGGLSPESTIPYYQYLVDLSAKHLPELVYPEIVIYSVNFGEVVANMRSGNADKVRELFQKVLDHFNDMGVEVFAIACNTMHIHLPYLNTYDMEVVHIVDVVGDEAEKYGYKKLMLFGTKRLLDSGLYKEMLGKRGIEVVYPEEEDAIAIDKLIFRLGNGEINDETRAEAMKYVEKYKDAADAIILGCTELPLVVPEGKYNTLDTTHLHAKAIFRKATGIDIE